MPSGMSHRRRIRAAALLVLLAAGCGPGDDDAAEPGAPRSHAQRVILITCDTLRADRLGVYGYPRPTSPELDAFARECVVFENAWSSAPMTAPALASVMTGRLPDELGMHSNKWLLPPAAETFAEAVSAAGIPTAAIVSNWVLRKRESQPGWGLSQGFASYDDRMDEVEENRPGVFERRAAATTDAAIAWLDARPGERFFLWVHYQDPHGPYTPPEDCVDALARPLTDEPDLPVGKTQAGLREIPEYQVLGEARAPEHYRIRYDAEVRYFDRELGRLLAHLRETGLLDGALVVFTADHGESLGEHDYWFSHGQSTYRELLHVPLIVRFPSLSAVSPTLRMNRDRIVGHVDLLPTMLDALGLREVPGHGRSFLGPWLGNHLRVLVHTLREPGTEQRWEGATDGYFHYVGGPRGRQLFDLERDPAETADIGPSERPRLVQLETALAEELQRLPPLDAKAVLMTPDSAEQDALNDLGYAGDEPEDDADHEAEDG
jgi:arylsulfatase A-like enzyme